MSTYLMWKSFELTRLVYTGVPYPHIFTPDPNTETVLIETKFEKLLGFHMSSVVLFSILLCVFHFLARSIFDASFPFIYLTPSYVALAVFISLHLATTHFLFKMGDQFWDCLFKLFQLKNELGGCTRKPIGYATTLGHFKLSSRGLHIKNILSKN